MGAFNKNSGYGQALFSGLHGVVATPGKTMIVAAAGSANLETLNNLMTPDNNGVTRVYPTITLALAACGTNTGDVILLDPTFQTAPTLTELNNAAVQGVQIFPLASNLGGIFRTYRAAAALPQTATGNLFAVTGMIKIYDIMAEVTTAIQAQANAVKLQAVPTVGSAVDLSATLDINGFTVGRVINSTGTLASALVSNINGVLVGMAQSGGINVPAGFISLNTAASNTGALKWTIFWEPLYPGAGVYAV